MTGRANKYRPLFLLPSLGVQRWLQRSPFTFPDVAICASFLNGCLSNNVHCLEGAEISLTSLWVSLSSTDYALAPVASARSVNLVCDAFCLMQEGTNPRNRPFMVPVSAVRQRTIYLPPDSIGYVLVHKTSDLVYANILFCPECRGWHVVLGLFVGGAG